MKQQSTDKIQVAGLIVHLCIPLLVGITASVATRPQIAGWYSLLHKPGFTPPNWLFPVTWTVIYLMMGTAAYLVWQKRNTASYFKSARAAYIVQLLLNFCWSIVFFGMHNITGGLLIIVLLGLSIIVNMYWFARLSSLAAWLLLPYLCWVSYASVLNLYIYLLNR